MADIEHQITIPHPISDVYNTVTDFEDVESMQRWQPALQSVGVTAGNPLRTGSMIGMTRRFRGSSIFVNLDVMDLQRNKHFELKGMHGRFVYHRQIEFSPSGRETRIHDHITLKIPLLYFWYGPLARMALRKQTAQEWENLKALLSGA